MTTTAFRIGAMLGMMLLCASAAQGEDYSAMAPIDQYLMARPEEIAMAKSAAPPAIADHATIIVLTRHGYETAIDGSEWFRLRGGTRMDVAIRFSAILESAHARAAVLQPSRRALHPALHDPTHGIGAGGALKTEIAAAIASRYRGSHATAARSGRDDLHDVEARLSQRRCAQLGAASDVLFPTRGGRELGRGSSRCAADAEPAVPRIVGSDQRDHGAGDALVRWRTSADALTGSKSLASPDKFRQRHCAWRI